MYSYPINNNNINLVEIDPNFNPEEIKQKINNSYLFCKNPSITNNECKNFLRNAFGNQSCTDCSIKAHVSENSFKKCLAKCVTGFDCNPDDCNNIKERIDKAFINCKGNANNCNEYLMDNFGDKCIKCKSSCNGINSSKDKCTKCLLQCETGVNIPNDCTSCQPDCTKCPNNCNQCNSTSCPDSFKNYTLSSQCLLKTNGMTNVSGVPAWMWVLFFIVVFLLLLSIIFNVYLFSNTGDKSDKVTEYSNEDVPSNKIEDENE